MIVVGSIEEMFEMTDETWDCWAIVHSCKREDIPNYAKQVTTLAPKDELFASYRDVVHQGRFDQEWFDTIYVPTFLKELAGNQEAYQQLHELSVHSDKSIFLACFCLNPRLCHRTIVANLLHGMGANVCGYDERWEEQYGEFERYSERDVHKSEGNVDK